MGVSHTIIEDMHVQQLKWYGHVQRLLDQRFPQQINWTPQGQRKT